MKDQVYKIFTATEWIKFQKNGRFSGSATDLHDGFIHLSTKTQVNGVIERYFSGLSPLYVAGFSGSGFIQSLTWESSGSEDLYPHLYDADLMLNDMAGFVELNQGDFSPDQLLLRTVTCSKSRKA